MANVESKACSRCKQILPASSFTADRRASSGLQPRCKACCAEVQNARRLADPEANRIAQREYRRKNPERAKAWQARNKAKNGDKIRARAKAYYRANKERCIAWVKENRKKNPERTRELARGWQAKRRALKAGGVSAVETAEWFKAQPKVCHWCGVKCAKNAEIDHIIPISRGGEHQLRNLCVACLPCNRSKHAKDPIEFAQSLGKLL